MDGNNYFHVFRAFCNHTIFKVNKKKLTKTFQELGIDVDTTKALKESGYEDPFPIQQEAIPLMLKGIDVIGQAHTGTGKTAATYIDQNKAQRSNTGSNTCSDKRTSCTSYCGN